MLFRVDMAGCIARNSVAVNHLVGPGRVVFLKPDRGEASGGRLQCAGETHFRMHNVTLKLTIGTHPPSARSGLGEAIISSPDGTRLFVPLAA